MIRWTGLAPWEFEIPLPVSHHSVMVKQQLLRRGQPLDLKTKAPQETLPPRTPHPYSPKQVDAQMLVYGGRSDYVRGTASILHNVLIVWF